jgi:hypothetical protein
MRYRLMATYRGVHYEAGVGPAGGDVVLFAACPPPEELGFEPATGHWRKPLQVQEVQALWESRPMGIFRGERCIVLDDLGDRLHIAYLGHDAYQARRLGYWQVDRGVFELVAPRSDVSNVVEERAEYALQPEPPAPEPPTLGDRFGPLASRDGLGPVDAGIPPDLAVIPPASVPRLPLEAEALEATQRLASARRQADPVVEPEPPARRRRAEDSHMAAQRTFAELASQAAIPPSAYSVGEEVDGAMCLIQTDEGFEVFNAVDGARHEMRFFEDEESAYFYLFGVLAAEAVRTGRLANFGPDGTEESPSVLDDRFV